MARKNKSKFESDLESAIHLAWENGRLLYKLRPHQARAYEQFYTARDSKKFVICAGRRFGKSVLLLALCTERSIRSPGVQCSYVAPVERGLSDYITPIIDLVFDDCPEEFRPTFRTNKNDLLFPNGSRIIFNGCNMRNYRYMRGQKLALAVVDEMSEVDDLEGAVDDVLFPAVWDSHGEMVLSGTPPVVPSAEHPVVRYVETAKQTNSFFHGTVYDAGYTEEDIQVAMREVGINGKDSARFRREFMAEFVKDDSAVVIPEFNESIHVKATERPRYYDWLFKAVGADLGVVDNTACLFAYYDFPKAKIVIQDEFLLSGDKVRTDILAGEIKTREQVLGWQPFRVSRWSDNTNLMLINDLTSIHGLGISPTDKEAKAEMVNKVRILFQQNRIEISPNCKKLIATLNSAFWDKDKKDFGRTKNLGHMDLLDALVYLVRNINMSTNPLPTEYAHDPMKLGGHDRAPTTQEGAMLKDLFNKEKLQPGFKPPVKRLWSAF